MASFPQASPPTPCTYIYPPPYAPHALPISFVSILPPAQYWHYIKLYLYVLSRRIRKWRYSSNHSKLWYWIDVSAQLFYSAALFSGYVSSYTLNKMLDGPQSWSGQLEKRRISRTCQISSHNSVTVQPVARSLHWLSYSACVDTSPLMQECGRMYKVHSNASTRVSFNLLVPEFYI
jgi:hypothetical protein